VAKTKLMLLVGGDRECPWAAVYPLRWMTEGRILGIFRVPVSTRDYRWQERTLTLASRKARAWLRERGAEEVKG